MNAPRIVDDIEECMNRMTDRNRCRCDERKWEDHEGIRSRYLSTSSHSAGCLSLKYLMSDLSPDTIILQPVPISAGTSPSLLSHLHHHHIDTVLKLLNVDDHDRILRLVPVLAICGFEIVRRHEDRLILVVADAAEREVGECGVDVVCVVGCEVLLEERGEGGAGGGGGHCEVVVR